MNQQLNAHQLSVLRLIPAFKDMEERKIKADENAARAERVAKGLEPLEGKTQ